MGVLDELRRQTAPAHRRLECHPLLGALLRRELTCDRYTTILGMFYRYYRALEPALAMWAGDPRLLRAGYRYRPRAPLLREDLSALGRGQGRAGPPKDALPGTPPLDSGDAALGVLYVIEGATMGGRVIAPRLRETLGVRRERGGSYFHLYEHGDWPVLRDLLEACQETETAGAAGDAAQETFACLHGYCDAWLAEMGETRSHA
ncbi:biliverdin-producing heme oxygenase [Arhodomonas sp. SL1]|uniref:biliverdin-producing heme oxygenase n=1 Tax=Arhodomonas sp. SL1 TaxID=3425691 RepID=UPI003F885B26